MKGENMIEKMKFLSITGPTWDIDRVINSYLSKYEIHLENALSELSAAKNLSPFVEPNPYKEPLSGINSFYDELKDPQNISPQEMDSTKALEILKRLREQAGDLQNTQAELEKEKAALEESIRILQPFREVHYDLFSVLKFQYIRCRFGRIEKEYFQKFEHYIYESIDTIFIKCGEDEHYIWGVYFMPHHMRNQVDAIYSTMHFERLFIPDNYTGDVHDAYETLQKKLADVIAKLQDVKKQREAFLTKNQEDIVSARESLSGFSDNFDIRRLAACTRGEKEMYYILCGWMTEQDALSFQNDIKDDTHIFCIIDGEEDQKLSPASHAQPPTKLKNPKLFKPFEMYIKMYGLPAYNEMDPTWFVAITYSFIFGAMFGDVGQGLLLFIGGYLLYRFKNIQLAGIISCACVFSTFFGFMFGSIFGFEDVLPALWLRPMNHMMTVPFIGKLNTVFIVAICFGMGIILLCMVFNILNARKCGDVEKTWFDTNAVAGLVFYGSLTAVIGLILSGRPLPGGIVLFVMFGIPLIVIFLKEPLTNIVEKKAEILPGSKGMFVVQGFFEMFEVLLSYFSNTLSFVRIGAFAVSHAAMMEVVLMLAGAESGSPNWIVVVLGNLFVSGMEGLIVGIQVLRLEYYEIFSRFYKGTGRSFEPFRSKKTAAQKK